MRGISFWFLLTAAISVTVGMLWGILMSATTDHSMAPAHAHLNLIGWVTMALFGFYYHLVPRAGERVVAKVQYAIATAGLLAIVPGIAMAIRGDGETLAKLGSVLTLLSMLIFLYVVITGRDRQTA